MSVFDLSRYQPEDRIQELVNNGNCDGVIIKIGEWYDKNTEPELDPKFITHVNEAVRLNIPFGIYYMCRAENKDEIIHEAQWINDRVAEYLNGQEPSLGTWWDLERGETKREDIYTDVKSAIQTMQSWWNNTNKIGIYASYSYFHTYLDLLDMSNYNIPVWNAQYGNHNSLADEYGNIVAWQFTTNNNYQDENVWYGFTK